MCNVTSQPIEGNLRSQNIIVRVRIIPKRFVKRTWSLIGLEIQDYVCVGTDAVI